METFALAAISFTLAVSLLIRKKKNPVHIYYALFCLALFLRESGTFFLEKSSSFFFQAVHDLGALSIPPLLVVFTRSFLGQAFIPRWAATVTAIGSLLILTAFFFPFGEAYHSDLPYLYTLFVLAGCYLYLLVFTRKRASATDRKRMIYVAVACIAAAAISLTDVFSFLGYGTLHLSKVAVAALLYFLLMIITHSELPELYEIMARAFITLILIIFATIVFFLIIGLFGKGSVPELTTVLMASLLIVIALDPLRLILRNTFGYLFPASKEIFASLYSFDEELEKEKTVLLEEMATGLAHEIRNPLGSIKGAAQYLRSETDQEENRNLLDVIIQEVDRLNGVVSQFLNYARPYRLNLKIQGVNPIIEKAISLVRANTLSDRITVETDLNPDLPPVNIDAEQLIQVILNIAFNAIEAMPEGGTLTFRTSRIESEKGEAIGIAIRDTGKGIGKEGLQNIFKPFFTTKDRGIGLGLAICQRIIRNHGGYIRVKSIPGQGSIFYIRIGVAG